MEIRLWALTKWISEIVKGICQIVNAWQEISVRNGDLNHLPMVTSWTQIIAVPFKDHVQRRCPCAV